MKILPLISGALIISALAGCAIVPYPDPGVVYAAPPPSATIIVRPSHGFHGHRGGRHWHHRWR
jgi:hypothetical protein